MRKTSADRMSEATIYEPNSGCLLYLKSLNRHGYGKFVMSGQRGWQLAHRASYILEVGNIPEGLQLDHLCRNRACVNPRHLEVVPNRVNVLRGVGFAAVNARLTECRRGHPFDEVNTYHMSSTERACRTCRREASRSYMARKRAV